ncbi:MAG: glycosyltransferase family 4 protein [Chloroflexi bacterium]|nr:glycosyltransferase family 4 protein [Chloroflexota bacterium]
MRVALLGPFPDDVRGGLAGGVDRVVLALADGLAARPDVELHVVTAVPGLAAGQTVLCTGFTLHRVPHRRGDRLLFHQPLAWPIRRKLDAIAPDVVHAQMIGPHADAALQSGRPAVISLHGVVFREAALALAHSSLADRARWLLDAWYERWIIRRATDLIATSPYVIPEYRAFTRARFHEIDNPIPDFFFEVSGRDRVAHARPPTLLCVARVIPRKDILTLIEVFGRVAAALPGAVLEIAGQTDADPAYTAACIEAVQRLATGSDSVRFLGNIGGQALAECYARADVVLLTSRQETAPLVVSEAMAAGRPLVATRAGGVPLMVRDGVTGFLTEPGDVAGLTQATLALLTQPDRCRAFGQAGRVAAEQRFRLATIVDRTMALYADMIARAADGSG